MTCLLTLSQWLLPTVGYGSSQHSDGLIVAADSKDINGDDEFKNPFLTWLSKSKKLKCASTVSLNSQGKLPFDIASYWGKDGSSSK